MKLVKWALIGFGVFAVLLVTVAVIAGESGLTAEMDAKAESEHVEASYQAQAKKDAAKRAEVKAEQASEESLTDELRITKAARSAFGDAAVKSVTYVDGINVAMIAIDKSIVLSANSDRKQFLLAVRETIQEIADMDGLVGVDVRWKDGDMRLMELRFEGDAIARAAKATHVDDLTAIAGEYWAHSGLEQ